MSGGRTPRVLAAVGLLALGVWGVGPRPLWEVLPAGTSVPTTVVLSGPVPDALRGVVELVDGEAPLPSVLPLLTERLEPRPVDVRRFQVVAETCHVEGEPSLTVLGESVLALTFGDEVRTSAPPRCAAPDVRAFVLDVPADALEREGYRPPPERERAEVSGALDAELLVDAPLADELYAPTIHVTAELAPGEEPYAVVGPLVLPAPEADERRFQVVADVCGRTGPPVFATDAGALVAEVPTDGRECAVPERAVFVVDVRD